MKDMKIYLGADHAGFSLKEKIKKYFDKFGLEYEDLGGEGKKDDDYPDFALKVGKKVSKGGKGILICGSGTGMVVAANKIKGVRAGVGYDSYSVIKGREDNDINVLCLRSRKFSDRGNLKLVKLWLRQEFSGKARHKRRIKKISFIEGRK